MSEISQYTEGLHEECGVFGIYDKTGETDMVSAVYASLCALAPVFRSGARSRARS